MLIATICIQIHYPCVWQRCPAFFLWYDVAGCCNNGCYGFKLGEAGCCSMGCLLQHPHVRVCERESNHTHTEHTVCVCAEIMSTRSCSLLQSASRVTIHVSGSAALLFFYCVMLRDVATTDVMVSSRVWQAVAAWGVCCNTLTCVCVCERVSTLTLQHTVCVCAEILSTRSWSSLQSASRVTIHVSCSAALLFF